MKKEYDFSKAEKGKFYHPDAIHYLPIYLEPEMMQTLSKISQQRGIEISALVNELIKKDLPIIKSGVK